MAAVLVQKAQNTSAGTSAITISSANGWATPTAGNILVAWGNADTTLTLSGWTAGPSVVDGNAAYMWYKVSTGAETTIPFTPGGSTSPITVGVIEYSGVGSPRDVQNQATAAAGATSGPAISVTGTSASGDLYVALAGLHAGTTPSAPSWTNSFVNQVTATAGTTGTTFNVGTFVADFQNTSAVAVSTTASWTGSMSDRQTLIIAFPITAPPSGAISLVGSTGVMSTTAGSFGPLTAPGTLAAGDFVVAVCVQNQSTAMTWTGAGWNVLSSTVNATGLYAPLVLYRIWAAGAVMPSVTSTTGKWAYSTMAWRSDTGVMALDLTSIGTGQTVAGTTITPPSIAGVHTNAVSILPTAGRASATGATAITTVPPTNWLEGSTPSVSDISTNAGTTAALQQVFVEMSYRLAQSGTVTPGAATSSGSSFRTAYHITAYGVLATVTPFAGWGLQVNS